MRKASELIFFLALVIGVTGFLIPGAGGACAVAVLFLVYVGVVIRA